VLSAAPTPPSVGTNSISLIQQSSLSGWHLNDTIAVPTAPTNVTSLPGNSQVSLTWTAPSNNGGSRITDYTVQYSSNGGSTWTDFPRSASTTTTRTVTGLTNGTSYVFRVAAANAAGKGSSSSTSAAVTPQTVPAVPTNVTGTPGNGQVSLKWTAPSSNGGSQITDYTIRYSSDNWVTSRTWQHNASVSTTALITGLRNGVTYKFRVAANNASGIGSDATATATPSDPAATKTVNFVKSSTVPATIQFTYSVRDENGKLQSHNLYTKMGSLDRIGKLDVPDYNSIVGSVKVVITATNLPRGLTKTQIFNLPLKTNYSYRISTNYLVYDPVYGFAINITCQ